jgi:PIN domain nuclease of toxin-antitoxin system
VRLLLDTHVFIWWDSEPKRLSHRALALCNDPENELVLSVVSLWEIQIKSQIDKIRLRLPLPDLVRTQQETNSMVLLPLTGPHVYTLDELPHFHRDPFDRMLVAQAKVEKLRLISSDEMLKRYPIELIW